MAEAIAVDELSLRMAMGEGKIAFPPFFSVLRLDNPGVTHASGRNCSAAKPHSQPLTRGIVGRGSPAEATLQPPCYFQKRSH